MSDYLTRYQKGAVPDWKDPWLIQRLDAPFRAKPGTEGSPFARMDNPFAFGGGLQNGGLGKEAMSLLREIFSFDYMGSAEFEFGSVPAAFNRLRDYAVDDVLTHSYVTVDLARLPQRDVWNRKTKKSVPVPNPEGETRIWMLCHKAHISGLAHLINQLVKDEYKVRLKEGAYLNRSLFAIHDPEREEYATRVRGWLDLHNASMFFTDLEMFDATAELFGQKREST